MKTNGAHKLNFLYILQVGPVIKSKTVVFGMYARLYGSIYI